MEKNKNIPEKMLAAGINEADGTIEIKSVPVPVPGKGQVLVKIAAAPINPSDIARIRHLAVSDRKNFIAGIEGCGRVIAHGKGLLPSLWMGKRVACSSTRENSGTWAEYMVTAAMSCIPLPGEISDEQGCMLLVNPLTAAAFIEIVRKKGHKAFINTAAASALGRIVEFMAEKRDIPLIQIVRSDAQVKMVTERGGKFVLNSNATGFEPRLTELAHSMNATLALDAVGGQLTRTLLQSVPYGSTVMVYGNLAGEDPVTHHRAIVTENKSITGFYLVNWLKEQGMATTLKCILEARNIIKNDVRVPVHEKRPLAEVHKAIEGYFTQMSAGKVLLIPDSGILLIPDLIQ